MAKLCECGCGKEIVRRDRPCRPNRFLFGHQTKGKPSSKRNTIEGLIERLVVREGKCWLWQGRKQHQGYAVVDYANTSRIVHKLFYEHFVGPVPKGMELHHRCENKGCVNWECLELLDRKEHLGERHLKTHCKHGHEFTPENTKHNGKQRLCRICQKRYHAESYQRRKLKDGRSV